VTEGEGSRFGHTSLPAAQHNALVRAESMVPIEAASAASDSGSSRSLA